MCFFLFFAQTKSVPILESLRMFIFYLELSAPVTSPGSSILVLKFQHECYLLRQAFPGHPSIRFHLTQPPIMSSFYFLFRIYLLFSCSLALPTFLHIAIALIFFFLIRVFVNYKLMELVGFFHSWMCSSCPE